MNYIDKFLEYLKSVKKHSDNTIISYQDDLKELASAIAYAPVPKIVIFIFTS